MGQRFTLSFSYSTPQRNYISCTSKRPDLHDTLVIKSQHEVIPCLKIRPNLGATENRTKMLAEGRFSKLEKVGQVGLVMEKLDNDVVFLIVVP